MKTIAFIDSVKFNIPDAEFNRIASVFMKHNDRKFMFLIYCNSLSKNSYKFEKGFSNKNIKYVSLPIFFKNFLMFFHALLFSDLMFFNGIRFSFLFPFISLVFRKKIVLRYIKINDLSSNVKSISAYISLLREFFAVKFAHRIVTNHDFLKDYLSAKYAVQSDYIENGGSHVERVESTFSDHLHYPFLKYMYAIAYYNGDSDNCIESVLDAFKQTKHKYIVVIGNWDCNEHSLMLKNKYSGYSNIYLLYPVNSKRKRDLILSNSILCIHSSLSVYLNDFLIESMSLKLPVLAFESINNKFLTEGKASYYKNTIEIKNYIEHLSIEKMRKNAHSMYDIASVRYHWDFIFKSYNNTIDQVLFPSNISTEPMFSNIDLISRWYVTIKNYIPKLSFLRTIYNIFL